MRIVCVSDTHSLHDQIDVPAGDVLVHAGDLTMGGTESETNVALAWLDALPHRTKLLVPGNHDFFFDGSAPEIFHTWRLRPRIDVAEMLARYPTITLLLDRSVSVDGVPFYGSPWQPWFGNWAFNFARYDKETPRETWQRVPVDTAVLVTHGPPRGILDTAQPSGRHVGDGELRDRLVALERLRLHVFGHIHEGYGRETHGEVTYFNASICTIDYTASNDPLVFDY